jgi:ArsR family transcriptional regulator
MAGEGLALIADMHMSLYDVRMSPGATFATLRADDGLDALRAIAEESRLRILAVLARSEVTVTDLTEILGQSQPRVSRHLRVLVDAGLVVKHREGTWAYFRLADGDGRPALVRAVLSNIDPDDGVFAGDAERLEAARTRRADAAADYFERIAPVWDEERSLHASAADVEGAILDVIGDGPLGRVLDVGTGTGRMVQLLADRAERCVGLDTSHSMLAVARANLERLGVTDWELRQGDVHSPPLPPASFDLVVVHQVLHYLDDPARAVAETARLVAPGGRLLVVDLAPHRHEFLRAAEHRRLGFTHDQLGDWFDQAGLETSRVVDVRPPAGDDGLTVTVWLAHHRISATRRPSDRLTRVVA